MTRELEEVTARINRDELLDLLSTMSPAEQQPITVRTSVAEVQAELARAAEIEESARVRTAREVKRAAKKARKAAKKAEKVASTSVGSSMVRLPALKAALLPPYKPVRFPTGSLTIRDVPESRSAAREVVSLLDVAPELVEYLSAEQIAMLTMVPVMPMPMTLPADLGTLLPLPESPPEPAEPEAPWEPRATTEPQLIVQQAPPALTTAEVVEIVSARSRWGQSFDITVLVRSSSRQRLATLIAGFVAAFIVGVCAACL